MELTNLQRKEYEMVVWKNTIDFYNTIDSLSIEGYVITQITRVGDYPFAIMERDVLSQSLRDVLRAKYEPKVSPVATDVVYDAVYREISITLASGMRVGIPTKLIQWQEEASIVALSDLSYDRLKAVRLLGGTTIEFPHLALHFNVDSLIIDFLGEKHVDE